MGADSEADSYSVQRTPKNILLLLRDAEPAMQGGIQLRQFDRLG